MRVHIWCDGAAMPNGGPAGAGYVVVGGVHLLGSEALRRALVLEAGTRFRASVPEPRPLLRPDSR
jgi:ribonuclease HI